MNNLIVNSRMGQYAIHFLNSFSEVAPLVNHEAQQEKVLIISNTTVFPLYGVRLVNDLKFLGMD